MKILAALVVGIAAWTSCDTIKESTMRTLIFAGLTLIFSTSFASAGSFTVTTTPEQDAQLAALKMTPQQIVTQRLDAAKAADTNRKLAMLRQACSKGDKSACDAIAAATKGVK